MSSDTPDPGQRTRSQHPTDVTVIVEGGADVVVRPGAAAADAEGFDGLLAGVRDLVASMTIAPGIAEDC